MESKQRRFPGGIGRFAWTAIILLVSCGLPTEARSATLSGQRSRLVQKLFPVSNPGYLRLVGPPPLRVAEAPGIAQPIGPAGVILYAVPPPPENSVLATSEPTPPEESPPETTRPTPAEPTPRELGPEDFIPYFQLGDGATPGAEGTLRFTPARSALPRSAAEYHQQ